MQIPQLIGTIGFFAAFTGTTLTAAPEPWRLHEEPGLPDWLLLNGSTRVRYEALDGQFRSGYDGGDQQLAARTLIEGQVKFEHWSLVAELLDSRQALSDEGSPIDTSMVDTTDWLQAYLQLSADDLLQEGSSPELRLGRQTMDLGSRRLVARNQFRNTLNAFDGAALYWNAEAGPDFRLFYFMPVVRRPSAADELLDNHWQADRSYDDYQFWGLHSTWESFLVAKAQFEAYFYGLNEGDRGDLTTKDRHLYTPGIRLSRKPSKGAWDFDAELAAQFGEQHNSTKVSDTLEPDHWAQFAHLECGYTYDVAWAPRIALLFDYASGDEDPNDGKSNRFDTLFGARRFDYGPTGIFGSFARSNIVSPGLGLKAKLTTKLQALLTYRAYWLASDTDAWTVSGLRDTTGQTDSFIGQQVEVAMKREILPGNLSADIGLAHLFAGSFTHDAPNASGQGDSTYGYVSLTFEF